MTKEQVGAAALKRQVARILREALKEPELWYRPDGDIRWGRLEGDLCEVIDGAFARLEEPKP